ncbi:3-hexulose-6-phosphate isomerase [Paraburkholderia caballeronis]|uniref:SIS domain-containing protein n=1 Tax=Paraburkholderia caballeronis TaxID=416943 RepID=UPI00106688F3|nr:SIS domain-containing protein [Paraburkholderia caballeronis]TDV39082.1 3-hexulose-6-phosphate isomerase [Paraburkholderia caballeronis]
MTSLDGDLQTLADRALDDVRSVFGRLPNDALDPAIDALASAARIVCYGVGREGLMMRAFAMRLYHLGLDAHVVGDMAAPPVGNGDLLAASAGPGGFSTVDALLRVARDAGARTLLFTAQPGGSAAALADVVCVLPAQTMADDRRASASLLPMGSVYEGAQFFIHELLVLKLRERLRVSPDAMRARHTNLE